MDDKRKMLKHFLAALAYRTQKALRGAPESFAAFRVEPGVRTPQELLRHMTGVLGYARSFLVGGRFHPELRPTFTEEIECFHKMLSSLAVLLETKPSFGR